MTLLGGALGLAALAGAVAVSPSAAAPRSEARVEVFTGPLVGHVTSTTAHIWAYAGADPDLRLRWWVDGAEPESGGSAAMAATGADHWAARHVIHGLAPATAYAYEVELAGDVPAVRPGRFTTAPVAGQPGKFRMAFSSCMNARHQPAQPSFQLLLDQKPAFHMLLGDVVYANTTNRERLWKFHQRQRQVPEFAKAIANLPTYAMWDDHDYGPNNSDGTAKGKEQSLRAFRELYANPGAGTEETPGAFYRYSWGDVDFFVLDGRYHRSPNRAPNDQRKRMLGDAQFEWLAAGLKASRARFKVLASGSTLQASRADGWRLFDFSRKRLFTAIMSNDISGVLYLSGDIHRCGIMAHPATETGGYPLFEVISSGIAQGPLKGFCSLDFDTTVEDPTVRIRVIMGDGSVRTDRRLVLSELSTLKAGEKAY